MQSNFDAHIEEWQIVIDDIKCNLARAEIISRCCNAHLTCVIRQTVIDQINRKVCCRRTGRNKDRLGYGCTRMTVLAFEKHEQVFVDRATTRNRRSYCSHGFRNNRRIRRNLQSIFGIDFESLIREGNNHCRVIRPINNLEIIDPKKVIGIYGD